MKHAFLLVILGLLLLLAGYVYYRTWQLLPAKTWYRPLFSVLYGVLWVSLFAGLVAENWLPPVLGQTLAFVGYTFLVILIYLLITYVLTDLLRLVLAIWPEGSFQTLSLRRWITVASLAVIFVSLAVGYYRFRHPQAVHLELTANKPTQGKQLRIVMASDLHLGSSIGKKQLQQYVNLLNASNPDLILLVGDLTDRALGPVFEQNLGPELANLKATHGVFAVSGNHEYYSGRPDSLYHYLNTHGVRVLRDETILIDSALYLLGRDDRTNPKRSELARLTAPLDPSLPVIVMDHQPYHLEEPANLGIDLQLSGHTHRGQFFPGNLIVKWLFEIGYGYGKKDNTHVYVSSGLGIWGPQYRIGSQSEYVVIDLSF
jgi:uncharacterized protein